MRRIGVFGGTFDPVHNGHLHLAREVRRVCRLDMVVFVPTGDSYHKSVIASSSDRYEMVKLAVCDEPSFAVSDVDITRDGPTYTVDTLRQLGTEQFPRDELFFIVGADAFAHFKEWVEPDEILERARLVVVDRPGHDAHISSEVAQRNGRVEWVNIQAMDVSSTQCKEFIKEHKSLTGLVPPAVEQYIAHHKLYRK